MKQRLINYFRNINNYSNTQSIMTRAILLFFFSLALVNFSFSQIIINEYSCSNIAGPTDAFGEREDWFEIYNPLAPNIDTDTIYYHFIISDVNELNELTSFWENFKRIDDRLEVINQDLIGYSYSIYSLEGDEIETGIVDVTIPVNNVSDFILIDKDGVLISYRLPKSD